LPQGSAAFRFGSELRRQRLNYSLDRPLSFGFPSPFVKDAKLHTMGNGMLNDGLLRVANESAFWKHPEFDLCFDQLTVRHSWHLLQ
jgi:hypothetical protein